MAINVNLKPGSPRKTKTAGKLPRFGGGSLGDKFARFKTLPTFDRMLAFIVIGWVIGPALIGFMFFTTRAKRNELNTNIAAALADSTKYSQLIAANKTLLARR